jgi:LmbE family N-acetylglucosaminyl deacetylase
MAKILCFVAHPDDETIGIGGTIMDAVSKGDVVKTVVFSFGEKSVPWMQDEVIKKMRIKEVHKVAEELGVSETVFLGLRDGKFQEDADKYQIKKKIKRVVGDFQPDKIFIHSRLDSHSDHRAANSIVYDALSKLKYKKYELYSFEVWNAINEVRPELYVDISSYFSKKMQLMEKFKSQRGFSLGGVSFLFLPVRLRAWWYGRKIGVRYAEKLYRLR